MAMAVAVAVTTVLLGTSPAQPANLTGIWLGQQKCDRFDGTKFVTKFLDDVMVISQTGNEIRMAALLIDDVFQLIYQGTVIDDVEDPDRKGQAAFTECTTTPTSPYQETGRATKVDVKPDDDGKFEGTSVFFEVGLEGQPPDTGTCAWTYKRVATVDPGVPSCAEVSGTSTLQASGGQSRRRP
jgi:hypothetical protein